MTNTEAITKLTNIMHDDLYSWHPSILTAFNMAVDVLRGADGDCISRQTLKDAFVETSLLEWEQLKKCYPMLKVVDEVPSTQSDHIADGGKKDDHFRDLTKKMDTISRQAAIDVAMECGKKIPTYAIRMKTLIEQLPSAQPEQRWIPCGKCIHADGKHRRCKILDRSINEDYFCYWAEPWKEGEADESD